MDARCYCLWTSWQCLSTTLYKSWHSVHHWTSTLCTGTLEAPQTARSGTLGPLTGSSRAWPPVSDSLRASRCLRIPNQKPKRQWALRFLWPLTGSSRAWPPVSDSLRASRCLRIPNQKPKRQWALRFLWPLTGSSRAWPPVSDSLRASRCLRIPNQKPKRQWALRFLWPLTGSSRAWPPAAKEKPAMFWRVFGS